MIVGVIGSGAIGPDLAYGFVSAIARQPGAKVYLLDVKKEALDAGMARIKGYVGKGVVRGKLAPKAAKAVEEALIPTMDLKDFADCDYVLEAASEDLNIKQAILKELEEVVRPDCLIGFATSGLPRAKIAARTKHPERCFVNHPFFPAWRSLPIEIVLSGHEEYDKKMIKTMEMMGKVPLITADVPCFAADDIFCNYISEAARIVEEGIATPAQVDKIVNDAVGGGGPFNVMDGTKGNLLTAHCQELMLEADTGTEWFKAPAILTKQGNKAWHDRNNPGDPSHDEATAKKVLDRILAVLLARTYFVVDNDICSPTDLNWMTSMALGFKQGLLDLAEEMGADKVHELCTKFASAHPGFCVPPSIADKRYAKFWRNLKLEKDGGIAILQVWRPESMNALSRKTIDEIKDAFSQLAADEEVKGVVFTSSNGALAGADINGLAALKTPEECRGTCLHAHPVQEMMEKFKKPVVAALNGPVLGGGAEFSMACHARVVGPKLMLGQPEVNLGLIPGYGGTQRLPRLIGAERAIDLLRTGRPVGAKEACEWGWASGEPVKDVIAGAKELIAKHLAGEVKLAPVSTGPVKVPDKLPSVDIGHRSLTIDAILVDVLRRGLAKPLAEGLAIEADGFAQCKETVDMNIGLTNFIQNGPRTPAAFLHE
ncbi:MAG: 3-hydroxyacyl-CoA dehydrogenase/enoyl-CoA hydratase family protein [Planctomycetota bacterium]